MSKSDTNRSNGPIPQGVDGLPFRLCLYVAGDSPSSRTARQIIAELTTEGDGPVLVCEVIDVLRNPARALEAGLLVTPTLIVEDAHRKRRFLGELRGRQDLVQLISGYRNT